MYILDINIGYWVVALIMTILLILTLIDIISGGKLSEYYDINWNAREKNENMHTMYDADLWNDTKVKGDKDENNDK